MSYLGVNTKKKDKPFLFQVFIGLIPKDRLSGIYAIPLTLYDMMNYKLIKILTFEAFFVNSLGNLHNHLVKFRRILKGYKIEND